MSVPGQINEPEVSPQDSWLGFSIADAFLGIEARLDRISEQVEQCTAEVTQMNLRPPAQAVHRRVNFPSKVRPEGILSVIPSEAPLSLESPYPSEIETIPSLASFSQDMSHTDSRAKPTTSERSFREMTRSGTDAQTVQSGVYEHRFSRQVKAFRSVDLRVAWQVYGTELKQKMGSLEAQPLMRLVYRTRAEFLWELLDDPESSRWAWGLAIFLKMLVLISMLTSELAALPHSVDARALLAFEFVCDTVFFVECWCRILSAPSKIGYLADPLNAPDVLSIVGLPLRACLISVVQPSHEYDVLRTVLYYFLPLVRFLKLLRRFDTIRLLTEACRNSLESLPVLAYIVALITLAAATGIYLLEPVDNIPSMPHALWLAIVTMTTVGYGDFYPISLGGYLMVSLLTFVSMIFLALPVGIIGYEFTQAWKQREQMLLMMRIRRSLVKWSYDANDMNILFQYADSDGDGCLNLTEFVELVRQMRIGLSVDHAVQIFALYHDESQGTMSFAELLRDIFPEEYLRDQQERTGDQQLQLQASKQSIFQALQRFESDRQHSAASRSVKSDFQTGDEDTG